MIFNRPIIVLLSGVFVLTAPAYAAYGVKYACPATISPDILTRMIGGKDLYGGEASPVSAAGITYELKASEGRLKMLRVKLSKAFKLSIDKMYYTDVELSDHAVMRKHSNEKFELATHIDVTVSRLLGKTNNSLLCGYTIKRDGHFLYQDATEEVAVKITFTP